MPPEMASGLRALGWRFYDFIGSGGQRLMCAWDTTPEDVRQFADAARRLARA
jgi:threonine aldolase